MKVVGFLKIASVGLMAVLANAVEAAPAVNGTEFFEQKIRPVLVDQCYKCHSATSEKLKGDLLVDSRAGLLKGGASKTPAIAPGEPEKSPLIHAIRGDDPDLIMPPKGSLTKQQIADFIEWIKMGAPDPRTEVVKSQYATPAPDSAEAKSWWAFVPVKKVAPPTVGAAAKVSHPVDQFIAAKLEEKKLVPVGQADKRTLIRRATFDLTGLPPTPEEVEAFVADGAADAYEKVIDRLLASPAYGERWGRHWLDVVRYADTAGESADYPVPQAYLYRNYVISSFNADKPYNRFLTEQLAGDLLPAANDAEHKNNIIATGFLAISRRFSVQPEYAMHLTYDDTIDTVGKAVLGLTVACARCHDHKFDPIQSKDYYSLYGIFAGTHYPYPGSETTKFQKDMVALIDSPETEAKFKAQKDKFASLEKEYKELKEKESKESKPAEKKRMQDDMEALKKRMNEVAAQGSALPTAYAVQDAPKCSDARIMKRGEPGDLGDVVPRGFLTVLGGQKLPKDYQGSGRLELAKWITDPANPLTARVMVNRIWQDHFGQGLVKTPSDFGKRGALPTHPELLDYLAQRFVDGGWSIKAMHKLVMTSAAYQRSSVVDEKDLEKDPGNAFLWRYERRRLDAEEIRDAMLATSGDLDRAMPAGHPFPPMSKWGWTQHNPFNAVYETKSRSIYLMQQRIKKHPFLAMFDGADPNTSTGDRQESTTPLQALFMMNDKFVFDQSEKFAAELIRTQPDPASRAARAIAMAYGRPAMSEEVAAAVDFMQQYQVQLKGTSIKPDAYDKASLAAYLRVILCSNEFFYVD